MPAGEKAVVNVVLLAGGFNTQMVHEILHKRQHDTMSRDSSVTMLRGSGSSCRVPPGLFAVGTSSAHSLESVVNHLRAAHQCNPLLESLWLVCNEADLPEYAGRGGFFDDVGRLPRDWQQRRALSNGCSRPDQWGGHVADLQIALRRIQELNDKDTIVVDASTFLWRDFNMQKLVSNMVIRGRNAIAVQTFSDTELGLYGAGGHVVVECDQSGQVPRIQRLDGDGEASNSALVARNVAYIERSSYGVVLSSPASSLPALFQELHAHGPVYGAHLPWGLFDLSSLLPLRYVAGLLIYSEGVRRQIKRAQDRAAVDADAFMALLQESDDVGLGKSTMMSSASLNRLLNEQFAEHMSEYDRHFFAMEASQFKGYQLPAYKLPPTFYMSTYRAQVSEAVL